MAQNCAFHVMTKPIGPVCNLDCAYCYYLHKQRLYPHGEDFRMDRGLLETYIRQYIEANPGPQVAFAWQGGEPTLMGLDFFRTAVALQQKHLPSGWQCTNALQTNGTLLDANWCDFLREHDFLVGISLDGPAELHDAYRRDKSGGPSHAAVMRGLRLLQQHGVSYNILCTINSANARHPLAVYRFLKEIGTTWLQFIPVVERLADGSVSERSVPADEYGTFLITVFDEWVRQDVGRVFVQIFEECLGVWAGLPAHLCVMAETCGRSLAMEHNGDVYACDHFVVPEHRLGNIRSSHLRELANAPRQAVFGLAKRDTLPRQ